MTKGYCLRVYDGYRPQRAVEHFLRWKDRPETGETKACLLYTSYSLPTETEEQKAHKAEVMEECTKVACGVPIEIEMCIRDSPGGL